MAERPSKSITDSIVAFLTKAGEQGATVSEICAVVQMDLGGNTLDASVRAALYRRLVGAKKGYRPYFDRYIINDKFRYRLRHELPTTGHLGH
jgi:hypothetical protein